jgi:hypothetical protein
MSVYLSLASINGKNQEGIGSCFQYHVILNILCQYLGVNYSFPEGGMFDIAHYSYNDQDSERWSNSFVKFFNFSKLEQPDKIIKFDINDSGARIFPIHDGKFGLEKQIDSNFLSFIEENKNSKENILIDIDHSHATITQFCANNVKEIFTKERIDKVKNNLIFTGKKYFDNNINISWHIRSPNPNDVPSELVNPKREIYDSEKDYIRFKNLIYFLKENVEDKKATLHIHSQGKEDDFSKLLELKSDNFSINLHLNEDPISDLYHMSNANLLIMANSSFSWMASLMNSNQTIVRDNFDFFTHNSLKTNYNYTYFI